MKFSLTRNIVIKAIAIIAISCAAVALYCPILLVNSDSDVIFAGPAYAGLPIDIKFIHSVQKTPVEEYLRIDQDGETIVLDKTVYHSFGVGLPFLSNEGNWRLEDGSFVLEDMNRRFTSVSLRTGTGTMLTIAVDGAKYSLYDMYAPGTKIDIAVAPRWKLYWTYLHGLF